MSTPQRALSASWSLVTWLALMALAGGSFALSYVHLGRLALPVALAIAGVKAVLVAMVFMELAVQRFANRAVLVVAVTLVVLLAALMAADVLTRAPPPLRPPASEPQGVRAVS